MPAGSDRPERRMPAKRICGWHENEDKEGYGAACAVNARGTGPQDGAPRRCERVAFGKL